MRLKTLGFGDMFRSTSNNPRTHGGRLKNELNSYNILLLSVIFSKRYLCWSRHSIVLSRLRIVFVTFSQCVHTSSWSEVCAACVSCLYALQRWSSSSFSASLSRSSREMSSLVMSLTTFRSVL